jgi:hypothetical protein
MSTPREYVLTVSNIEIQGIRSHVAVSKEPESKINGDFIPVIEKTPEVVRKLECFDEMTKALNWLMEKMPNYCIDKYDKEAPPIKSVAYWSDLEKLLKKAKGE